MRKFILSIMAFAAISFASCGNKSTETQTDSDSIFEIVEDTIDSNSSAEAEDIESTVEELVSALESGDTENITSTVEEANKKVIDLIAEGKEDEAKSYAEAIKKFVTENKEKLTATGNATVTAIVSNIEKLDLANLEESAKSIVSSLQNVAGEDAAEVEAKAKEAVEKLKNTDVAEKVENATNDIKDNAKKAVEDAKEKAKEEVSKKVDEKVENAKEKAKEKVNEGLGKLLGR